MTFLEAAYLVLKQSGSPMHHAVIYQEVVRLKLWSSRAKPRWVENSTYGTLIKTVQQGDMRFGKVGDGRRSSQRRLRSSKQESVSI